MKLATLIFNTVCVLLPGYLLANENEMLYDLDLEELMNIEVISISKKPQSVQQTAAAVQVISQVDIQRSGATSLPEVLRGVPGVHVAHIDGNKWAVSIRGFNDRFANKLLVLVDGRSIYTPIFSGVYWNMQDMLLEDIERIEVVRGPGGALWGANAVNGVINIITQHSEKTQGSQVSILGGSKEQIVSARFGGKINQDTHYRIFAKGRRADDEKSSIETTANDQWKNVHAGFRLDSAISNQTQWLVEGAYNTGNADVITAVSSLTPASVTKVEDTIDYQNSHILLRLNHQLAEDNKLQVQGYYDFFNRTSLGASLQVHTFDLDMQHHFKWLDNHEFSWGLGYRGVYDELDSTFTISFTPKYRYASTFSGFLQNEVQMDQVRLTVGSKFEHNDYTGFEFQPSARLLWQINPRHSLWTAISRSVRILSRTDENIRINFRAQPGINPTLFSVFGNPETKSEKVYSAELGYRALVTSKFSIDGTIFYNYYDDLTSQEQSGGFETDPLPAHKLVSSTFDNQMIASSYGFEIQTKWQVVDDWKLIANYSLFELEAQYRANSTASVDRLTDIETSNPQQQASLQSIWQLPFDLELNSSVYYTDKIAAHKTDAYTRVDLRLAWKPVDNFELSVVGQNLLDNQHKEYTATDTFYTEVARSVYGKIVLKF